MKSGLNMTINFPLAMSIIALMGTIFAGYVYMTTRAIIAEADNVKIINTSLK